MKTRLQDLTTCDVTSDGGTIELNFVDSSGVSHCLAMPFDRAQLMAMTLPQLLTSALRRASGEQARYVFPLGSWRIEGEGIGRSLITTFATEDGFEVTFGIPIEACRGLGWALQHEANNQSGAGEAPGNGDGPALN